MLPRPTQRDRYDRAWARRDSWRAVLAGAAALLLGLGSLAAVYLLARPLALVVLGVVLAAGFAPVVDWLSRRLPRALAAMIVFALLLLLLIGIGWLVVPALVEQANAVLQRLPELVPRVQTGLDRWGQLGDVPLLSTLGSELSQLTGSVLRLPLGLAEGLVDLLVVVFVAFYALLEAPAIRRFVLSLALEPWRARLRDILGETMAAMGGYVRGSAISGLAIGVMTYVGLLIIGVDYALVLALLAGVLELLPVIGPIVAAVPMLAVALLDSPTQALVVLVFVTVLQQAEANLLLTYIMRSQTDVTPLLVLVALLAGGAVGGLLGVLVAIPLAAALRVLTPEVIAPTIRRWAGSSERR